MSEEKYVPKVGEKCLYAYDQNWREITPAYIGEIYMIFTWHNGEAAICMSQVKFRELKDPRQEIIEGTLDVYFLTAQLPKSMAKDIIDALNKNGYTV